MPKSKSKTISKSKKVKKGRISSKKRFKIPKPKNIRKLDDDTVIITSNDNPKVVSGSFRKSFHELTKEDLDREYSASIDYKPNTESTIHQVDIQRGFTSKEASSGRAFVNTRVDRNDEITMHNHPDRNEIDAKWTRPSGTDISNVIYLKDEGYNLKASYIKSADGRYIRYKVVDMQKARKQARIAKDDYYALTNEKQREKYSGAVDYAIEQEAFRISQNELLKSYKIRSLSLKAKMRQNELEQQSINELAKIENDPKLTEKQKVVKIQEASTIWIKRMNEWDKKHVKKNPKFIPDDTPFRKRELMLHRRSFNEWRKVMLNSWGVEVKRMPKGFKHPIEAGE